jgi:peroxiredoxin
LLQATPNAQVEILAVSVDPHDKAQQMRDKIADKAGQDFPLLSDLDHRVIDRYGLLNEKSSRIIPHPATYVLDRNGVVRWKFIEVDYKVRPSNEDVLKEVLKVEQAK